MSSDYTPEQTELSSMADYVAALGKMCNMAEHDLCLFEKDFGQLEFNSESRHASLQRFLSGGPMRQLRLLAHDARYLSTRCPRMMNLLHQFGDRMFVYQTPASLHRIAAPFSVADSKHFVRRFHFDSRRGLFAIQDSPNAHALKSQFMELWAASHPAPSSARLRL
jgi:hypothetical protein